MTQKPHKSIVKLQQYSQKFKISTSHYDELHTSWSDFASSIKASIVHNLDKLLKFFTLLADEEMTYEVRTPVTEQAY